MSDNNEYPSCDYYNKKWNYTLKNEFEGCINDKRADKNPLFKNLTKEQIKVKDIDKCCEEIMQCNDKNTWLQKNNINIKCALKTAPVEPHFGEVQQTQVLYFGVY